MNIAELVIIINFKFNLAGYSNIYNVLAFKVKRRVKPPPKEKEEKKEREYFEEREELDFQFDEELDGPVPSGRHNTFTDWLVQNILQWQFSLFIYI